jgi:hypothetical protein
MLGKGGMQCPNFQVSSLHPLGYQPQGYDPQIRGGPGESELD